MTVWIVTTYGPGESENLGVFSTEAKADAALAKCLRVHPDAAVEEWEVDDESELSGYDHRYGSTA